MSVSAVGTSPMVQWLQNYLSAAGSASGSQSSCATCGDQSTTDTTSISQEAKELNARMELSDPTELVKYQHSTGSDSMTGKTNLIDAVA